MTITSTRGRETIPGEGIKQEPSPVHANLLQSINFDAVPRRPTRPMVNISVGGRTVRALLDTGSAVSLCNSELLKHLKDETSRQKKSNFDLRSANGDSLRIRDIRRAKVHLNGRYTPTEMIFVDHLQVPCILAVSYTHLTLPTIYSV